MRMSLIEQLKRLAVPVSSSYAPESIRSKSLVYEDPSRVDSLSCFQESLQALERLANRDEVFNEFKSTLFAESSCRLELCNLLAHEKKQLDCQVARFLCFTSPYLRHYDAIRALEWLIHKFQIHLFYVEDLIRCVMPYHETGLFAKFLQLIDFKSCASEFKWLKPYAENGRALPRAHLVRECFRNQSFLSFLNSMILNAVKLCEGLSCSRLNDLTAFFVSTVTSFCESTVPDPKLALIVDSFQPVISCGLRTSDCPPFHASSCLAVLRISLRLNLNRELVLSWIKLLLKHSQPSKARETLRVVIKLMRSQHISLLPNELASMQAKLMAELSISERESIEREESNLLSAADANQLAADAIHHSDGSATSLTLDFCQPSVTPLLPRRVKSTFDDATLLKEHDHQVHLLHMLLKAVSNGGCLFNDSKCRCPVWTHSDFDSNILCELLYPILHVGRKVTKLSKFEARRAVRLLQLVRAASDAHIATCTTISSQTNLPNSPNAILGTCLDQALPLLLACLLHPASTVRYNCYMLLVSWIPRLKESNWSCNQPCCSRLTQAVKESSMFSEELAESLQGEPLSNLIKSALPLSKFAVRILLNEPFSDSPDTPEVNHYGDLCWSYALRLFSAETVKDIVTMKSNTTTTGWYGILTLIRSSHDTFLELRTMCLSLLTEPLFAALTATDQQFGSAVKSMTLAVSPIRLNKSKPAHIELLDALCDLTLSDSSGLPLFETVLYRICPKLIHFDYLLLRLDPTRCKLNDSSGKSLLARVTEARETRRRHRKSQLATDQPCDPSGPILASNRLKLLGTILTVLMDSIPRLQSELNASSTVPNSGLSATTLKMLVAHSPATTRAKSPHSSSNPTSDTLQLFLLFTPLVHHLVDLLNQRQRTAKLSVKSGSQITNSDSSDSEADDTPQSEAIPTLSLNLQTDEATSWTELSDFNSDCSDTIARHCIYRLLLCIAAILTEAQASIKTKSRKRHRSHTTELVQSHPMVMLAVQSTVEPLFRCLTLFEDWVSLHQQVLLCFVLLANLFPLALSQRLLNLVQWVVSSHHLMRLDNVHSLSLIGRLVVIAVPALIRTSTDEVSAALRVLTLFADGLPRLARHLPKRRLAFYAGLLRGLSQATGPLAIDYATYTTTTMTKLTSKSPIGECKKTDRQEQRALVERYRESWVGSWLWAASLVFLNRNWPDEATADEVVPLLIDLHNQFAWDVQISAWYECIAFLSWLTRSTGQLAAGLSHDSRPKHSSLTDTLAHKLELVDTRITPPAKRRRITSDGEPRSTDLSDMHVSKFSVPRVLEPLISVLFTEVSRGDVTVINPSSTWGLTSRAVQLLAALLNDPTYDHKIQIAADDPLGFGAVYGRLVQQVVELMISAASTLSDLKHSLIESSENTIDFSDQLKQTLVSLQNVLVQIHDSVSGPIFIRMVSDLFDSVHLGLRRKALDLLAAKLTTLTVKCHPIPILHDEQVIPAPTSTLSRLKRAEKRRRRRVHLDLTLESGLVQLTAQLTAQYNVNTHGCYASFATDGPKGNDSQAFGSSFSRLSLSCLRDLAKLLAERYPGEFMRTTDILLESPACWWPVTQMAHSSGNPLVPKGSGCAEARSLVCLFLVECLQRLPSHSLCPGASATSNRLNAMLTFCLDHAMTSCQLTHAPHLTLKCLRNTTGSVESLPTLVSGLMHSRDQHLLASLTLLENLLELAIVHRRAQQTSSRSHSTNFSHNQWLQFPDAGQVSTDTMAQHLLRFVLQLGQLDLTACLGANPERSGSTLKQLFLLIDQLRRLLLFVTDLATLLGTLDYLLKSAASDHILLHGILVFFRELFEACGGHDKSNSTQSNDQLQNDLTQVCFVNPEFVGQLLSSLLSLASTELSTEVHSTLHQSSAALLSAIPVELRMRLITRLPDWVRIDSHDSDPKAYSLQYLRRITTVFHVFIDLSTRISAEDFSELSKHISLVDYLVLTFYIVAGQKRKECRKLAERYDLKMCLKETAGMISPEAHGAVLSGVECLRKWILAEMDLATCLDVGSGGSCVIQLPTALVSLLDVVNCQDTSLALHPPAFSDSDLSATMDVFVRSIAGDEALLRPLGSALCARIVHGKHWQMRLSAINLLGRVFSQLTALEQTDGENQAGTVGHCLLSDTLAALNEALEDDRPEVETAANRLFSEIERSGLSK